MRESPFATGREIIEQSTSRRQAPFFYRTKLSPLTFTLTLALIDDKWTPEKLYEIGNWLFKEDYREFITDDYIGKRYLVMATSNCPVYTNGNEDGYITVEFRNKYPYALSPIYIDNYDLSSNPTTTTIIMENKSNIGVSYYHPEIQIQLQGASTGFTLQNLSDGGKSMTFSQLDVGETLYIDCDKKILISDATGSPNRLGKMTGDFFRLTQGQNSIKVTGNVTIQTRMSYPIFN